MKNISNFFFFTLFLFPFLFTSLAMAQDSSGNFLIRPWAVGQTTKLQTKFFKNSDLTKTVTTTYSIVGQETVNGNNFFWLEIENDGSDGVTNIRKLQVRQPETADFENSVIYFRQVFRPRRELL